MMMMMTMKKKMVMVMISMILMINNTEWFVYHKYDEENDTGWFRWCLITLVHEYDDEYDDEDDDEDVNDHHDDDASDLSIVGCAQQIIHFTVPV